MQNVNQKSLKDFVLSALGVPFRDRGRDRRGWDCWGLLQAAFKVGFGLDLPSGLGCSHQEPQAALQALQEGARGWVEIPWGRERPGDVLLFRPCHVGLILGRGRMLHCREGRGTLVEHYDQALWRQAREGIYRHAAFA